MGHDHDGEFKSDYHHGVKQSSGHDIPVSIPVFVLTHVYIHLSIISRSTCGSIGARRWQGTNGIRVGAILHHLCIVNTIFAIPHRSTSLRAILRPTQSAAGPMAYGADIHGASLTSVSYAFTIAVANRSL